jgi:hypothetical protein
MNKGIAFIAGVLRLYMFRAYAPIFRSNSITKQQQWCSWISAVEEDAWVAVVWRRVVAEGVTTRRSSGGSCVGSGGLETCCSRGSH